MVFDASLADRVPLPDEAPDLTLRLSADSLPDLPAGEAVEGVVVFFLQIDTLTRKNGLLPVSKTPC